MASTHMDESGNITCTNNTTFYLYTEFVDETGNPVDLTGATGAMDVRTGKWGDPCSELVLRFTTENNRIIFGGDVDNAIVFEVDIADMLPLRAGQYYYDCVINMGSSVEEYFKGVATFTIKEGITKSV